MQKYPDNPREFSEGNTLAWFEKGEFIKFLWYAGIGKRKNSSCIRDTKSNYYKHFSH